MKMFIWKRVDNLTRNYHREGGLAIVAESLEAARLLVPSGLWDEPCEAMTAEPDAVYDLVGTHEPHFFVFQDAGCC